jgi:hypothetical protein
MGKKVWNGTEICFNTIMINSLISDFRF